MRGPEDEGGRGRPYKLYRAGRHPRRRRADEVVLDELEPREPQQPREADSGPSERRRRFRWRYLVLSLLALVVLVLVVVGVWACQGYRTVDEAVIKANRRIAAAAREALDKDSGGLFSHPTTILVLGVDRRARDPGRSDSIMLIRSNPKTHSFSQLSIARDMRVEVPGHGMGKINTGYFWGGPALAIKTVREFTGIRINHVVIVSFAGFQKVIDAVGGVDIKVPRTITSWYSGDQMVTFKKGWNHMDGKRAIIYARIRKADNDFYRQARQQQVVQALEKKVTRFGNLLQLPSVAAQLVRGISTDLTTRQLVELAWRKWRTSAQHNYRCVLQGTPAMIGGQSYVISDREANLRMIQRFLRN